MKSDQSNHVLLHDEDAKKTLGLHRKATLSKATLETYSELLIKTRCRNSQGNKGAILSRVAQLFDPLGLLGPVQVQSNLKLQEFWKCHVEWDDTKYQVIFV